MPHTRLRMVESALLQNLALSPLVGLIGHRQVGKTTLLEKLCRTYLSLDDPAQDAPLRRDVALFLSSLPKIKPVGLDECQYHESLFRGLKEWVRTHKKPGQFLLSGSVRFTSKRTIRESLTGRILYNELYPLLLSEICNQKDLCAVGPKLLMSTTFRGIDQLKLSLSREKRKDYQLYLKQGGLPGICFIRNSAQRASKCEDLLTTLLDRDLRSLYETTLSLGELRNILFELGLVIGEPVEWTELSRKTQVSTPTLKRFVQNLEALFIIRTIPVEGGRTGRVVYFEDCGEWAHVCEKSFVPLNSAGEGVVRFLFTQLRAQWAYGLKSYFEYFQFRTRNGALVPLALRSEGRVLGFLPINGKRPNISERRVAQSFLSAYGNSKLIFLSDDQSEIINDRMAILDPLVLV